MTDIQKRISEPMSNEDLEKYLSVKPSDIMKYADLSKTFKSDFDPNILPKMPKIATVQVIPPHNPAANSQAYKPTSDGDDSSVRSDGYYSELEQL